ncbi:MAG: ribonuclease H-like domain-containing protein [Candidatus Kerfeldbacteria bacterium]
MDHTSPQRMVFDIETQKTFDEVGENGQKDLGVSFCGVYSYSQKKSFGFFEKDLPKLEKIMITEKPMLIGFNSKHFDNPVLQPYFKELDLSTLPHLDILEEITKALGHRVKLDNVAQATLHEGKSGSGLDAIRWYREGDLDSLSKYCLDDVKVTRDVYEYGLRHGRIFYPSGGQQIPIPIKWGQAPLIIDKLMEAFKRHEQLEIDYFEVDDNNAKEVKKHTIEILSFDGDRFEAFCHADNQKSQFTVANVWDIAETGQTFAHQSSMF